MEVIYSYTRKQAIEDGVLIDITENVKGCPFKYPIAITSAVYGIVERAVENERFCNDYNGILWDIVWMAAHGQISGSESRFSVIITGAGPNRYHSFKMVCGPGDNGDTVLTVMLPNED